MEALIWETADELDQKLASRLRNIRKRRAISQQRLADMSGVSMAQLSDLRRRGRFPFCHSQKSRWHWIWRKSCGGFLRGFRTKILRR